MRMTNGWAFFLMVNAYITGWLGHRSYSRYTEPPQDEDWN